MPDRPIFRESAIEAYRRRREKDVVPRLISWPIVVCLWLLLAIVLADAWVSWSVRVPTYVSASGSVLSGAARPEADGRGTAAVLFLPPEASSRVRVGQAVHVQVGSSGRYVDGVIVRVEPGLVGPDEARERFGTSRDRGVITGPSTAAVARLERPLSPAAYAGSQVTARVEVGSRRPLELVPGVRRLIGGDS